MKNNIKILYFLFLSLTMVGCEDEINIDPFTEANPDTFFNNLSAFQNGVDGITQQLRVYYASTGSGMQGIPDILSDNVILSQTGRRSNELYYDYRYVANTGGALALYWSECYEAVNAANLVISQIDNLADGEAKDNILGQALAGRAFAHFDLVRTYGKIPTQSADANSSLGVVYVKVEDGDTGDPFAEPPRETVADNYVEIIGDLETALTLIGEDNGEGRFNKDVVNAILSRVYLYNGEYQKAIDAADRVSVDIAAIDELPNVYTDATNAGVVWKLGINTTSESNFSQVGVLYGQSSEEDDGSITTISEYVMDFGFFNSISPDDVRRDIMRFVGRNQGNNYNAIGKFLGEEGQINGLVDIKVIRAAEVVLNKAEAQFELGLEGPALQTLNSLRDLRYTAPYAGGETGQDLEDAIQFERRVELAYEGHRFFDLKRRGESVVRTNAGDLIDGSGTPPEFLTLPAGNFRFQFPIPLAELNANSNMDQNDGY